MGLTLSLPFVPMATTGVAGGTTKMKGNADATIEEDVDPLTAEERAELMAARQAATNAYTRPMELAKQDRNLRRQCYYHGFISLSDAKSILRMPGEFLVRSTILPPAEERAAVLSAKMAIALRGDEDDGTWPTTHSGSKGARHRIVIKRRDMRVADIPILVTGERLELKFFTDVHLLGTACFVTLRSTTATDDIAHLVTHCLLRQWPLERVHFSRLLKPIKLRPSEVHHYHLNLMFKLGAGSYGSVYVARWKRPTVAAMAVVVKIAIESPSAGQSVAVEELLKEAALLRDYDHPNVVRVFGVAAIEYPVLLVFEYVNGGSLDVYLSKKRSIAEEDPTIMGTTQKDRIRYCLQAACGVEYLHYMGAVHRDIAGRHCLLAIPSATERIVKIGALGLKRPLDDYKTKIKRDLPMCWTAPETLESYKWTFQSDVYSFAVLMWEIYSDGAIPYKDKTGEMVAKAVAKGVRPARPPLVYDNVWQQIEKCWQPTADERPKMAFTVQMLMKAVAETSDDLEGPTEDK